MEKANWNMFGFESNKDFGDPEINAFALIQFEVYWGVFHLKGFLYAWLDWGVATHAKIGLFWRLYLDLFTKWSTSFSSP